MRSFNGVPRARRPTLRATQPRSVLSLLLLTAPTSGAQSLHPARPLPPPQGTAQHRPGEAPPGTAPARAHPGAPQPRHRGNRRPSAARCERAQRERGNRSASPAQPAPPERRAAPTRSARGRSKALPWARKRISAGTHIERIAAPNRISRACFETVRVAEKECCEGIESAAVGEGEIGCGWSKALPWAKRGRRGEDSSAPDKAGPSSGVVERVAAGKERVWLED